MATTKKDRGAHDPRTCPACQVIDAADGTVDGNLFPSEEPAFDASVEDLLANGDGLTHAIDRRIPGVTDNREDILHFR